MLSRDLHELELAVVMIDGLEPAGITHVALGITLDGTKVPLSLREGSTENATVATALLADLADRPLGLHEEQLFVLDGAKERTTQCLPRWLPEDGAGGARASRVGGPLA